LTLKISAIAPYDALEKEQIDDSLAWIQSGAPIFRIQKPDVPHKHLVSYFVFFDKEAKKILLVDHKKAELWLPAGGHVEIDEHPKKTVERECVEELGVEADFWLEHPLFLSSTITVGQTAGHTDVSLWYLLKGHSNTLYSFDRGEFHAIHWFSLDEMLQQKTDPHMARFIGKLKLICIHL
jgi:8-oxo-dGTP diphosphatase